MCEFLETVTTNKSFCPRGGDWACKIKPTVFSPLEIKENLFTCI